MLRAFFVCDCVSIPSVSSPVLIWPTAVSTVVVPPSGAWGSLVAPLGVRAITGEVAPVTALVAPHVGVKATPTHSPGPRSGRRHSDPPSNQLDTIGLPNGLFRVLQVPEHHECEAGDAPGHPYLLEGSKFAKGTLQVAFAGFRVQVSHVNSVAVLFVPSVFKIGGAVSPAALWAAPASGPVPPAPVLGWPWAWTHSPLSAGRGRVSGRAWTAWRRLRWRVNRGPGTGLLNRGTGPPDNTFVLLVEGRARPRPRKRSTVRWSARRASVGATVLFHPSPRVARGRGSGNRRLRGRRGWPPHVRAVSSRVCAHCRSIVTRSGVGWRGRASGVVRVVSSHFLAGKNFRLCFQVPASSSSLRGLYPVWERNCWRTIHPGFHIHQSEDLVRFAKNPVSLLKPFLNSFGSMSDSVGLV